MMHRTHTPTSAGTFGAVREHGRIGPELHRESRRFDFVFIRVLAAATLILTGMLGAGLVGYRAGTLDWLTFSDGSSDLPRITHRAADDGPKVRACSQFTESYRTLPPELRSTHPGRPRTATPTATPNLAGIATDEAEILNGILGPAYQHRPLPVWLQAFDKYVAALRATAFVVADPAATDAVRAGVAELHQRALQPVLKLCYVAQ